MKDWKRKAELIKVLGVNQKAGVKVGDEIEHPLHGFKTKVVAVYKDFLGNERVLTEHTKRHVEEEISTDERWRKEVRRYGLENADRVLAEPNLVLEDTHRGAYIIAKAFKVRGKRRFAGVVLPKSNLHYILTVQPMSGKFEGDRYIKLYERKTEGSD